MKTIHNPYREREREREREILHPCSQPGWADWMEHSTHSYMSCCDGASIGHAMWAGVCCQRLAVKAGAGVYALTGIYIYIYMFCCTSPARQALYCVSK